jgi:hypothetical protein
MNLNKITVKLRKIRCYPYPQPMHASKDLLYNKVSKCKSWTFGVNLHIMKTGFDNFHGYLLIISSCIKLTLANVESKIFAPRFLSRTRE